MLTWMKGHWVIVLALGGGVIAFLWWRSRSSSSSSATTLPPYTPSAPSGSGGSGGTSSGGQPPVTVVVKYPKSPVSPTSTNPEPHPVPAVPPPPNTVPVKPPPGAKFVKDLGSTMPYLPSSSSQPYIPPSQPAHTSYSAPPSTQQLASLKAESPVTVNGSGQESTTGVVAYNSLVNQGYTPQQAVSVAAQIAAANSGVPAGTPQLVAGVPVTAGASSSSSSPSSSVVATNPEQPPAWESASNVPNPSTGISPQQQQAAAAAQAYFLQGGTGIPPGFVT